MRPIRLRPGYRGRLAKGDRALFGRPRREEQKSGDADPIYLERLEALSSQLEALSSRLEALSSRHEALSSRLEFTVSGLFAAAELTPIARLRARQAALRSEIDGLRRDLSVKTPGNPCVYGYKVYGQTDEDGIIEYILDRLGVGSSTGSFIELGCGQGIENNTHFLALKGYRGCWADGSDDNISKIDEALGGLEFDNLIIHNKFITAENVSQILEGYCDFLGTHEPSFYSLDIDGNDIYVMQKSIEVIRPLLICAEYNPKFPPPVSLAVEYVATQTWQGDDYHGASLQAFVDLLASDYKLVCCNLCGCNAFFVRNDRADIFPSYTASELYQPFRENLIDLRSEHRPSLRWLRDRLSNSRRTGGSTT